MLVVLTTMGSAFTSFSSVIGVSHRSPLLALITLASLVCAFAVTHFILDVDLFRAVVPNTVNAISIIKSLEYAVAADHYIIKIVLHLKTFDIWITNNYVWIATISWSFRFDITKCLGNGEPSWEHSERSLYVEIFLARVSCRLSKRLRPVNLTTRRLDTDLLELIVWLVVA